MTHLTLDEMAACVDGRSVPPEHAATCAACRAELRRWQAVADGLDMLAAEPPPHVIERTLTAIDAPPRHRRRTVLASAAAVAAIGAAAYGLSAVTDSDTDPRPGERPTAAAAAGLAATECAQLKVAAGTLRSANGSDLVLDTGKGKPVRTSAAGAKITHTVAGSLTDVTVGAQVVVQGGGTQRGVTAENIAVLPRSVTPPKPPTLPEGMPGLDPARLMAGNGTAMGTVSKVGSDGFTVGAGRSAVHVGTSRSTKVTKQEETGPGGLRKGAFTVAVGALGQDGTLRARTVQQSTPQGVNVPGGAPAGGVPSGLPSGGPFGDGSRLPSGGPSEGPFAGLGCDADAIAATALLKG